VCVRRRGGIPDGYANVGCGGGSAFTVAERRPETTVVGHDAVAPVTAQNRRHANGDGYPAVRFERTVAENAPLVVGRFPGEPPFELLKIDGIHPGLDFDSDSADRSLLSRQRSYVHPRSPTGIVIQGIFSYTRTPSGTVARCGGERGI